MINFIINTKIDLDIERSFFFSYSFLKMSEKMGGNYFQARYLSDWIQIFKLI